MTLSKEAMITMHTYSILNDSSQYFSWIAQALLPAVAVAAAAAVFESHIVAGPMTESFVEHSLIGIQLNRRVLVPQKNHGMMTMNTNETKPHEGSALESVGYSYSYL